MLVKVNPCFFLVFFCQLAATLFFTSLPCRSQKLEFGLGLGTMNYLGEVAPGFHPEFSRPAASLFFRHNVSQAVSFKYALAVGQLFADDSQSQDGYARLRNYSFSTGITELSAAFEYNFLDYRKPGSGILGSPYLHMGLALFKMKPKNNLDPHYSLLQIALPFGVGYRLVVAGQWNIGIELGARKTFTDNLDEFGSTVSRNRFQNGNPNNRDMYFFTQLMVSYTIYKVRCPF
jgi:hypothetical protein